VQVRTSDAHSSLHGAIPKAGPTHVQVGNRREKTFGRQAARGVLRAWNGVLETVWRGGVITDNHGQGAHPLAPRPAHRRAAAHRSG
jgi:hypothetical protein